MSSQPSVLYKSDFAAAFLLLRRRMALQVGLAYEKGFLCCVSYLVASLHVVASCEDILICTRAEHEQLLT
jgi:hypothetical protein